ncbi:YheC/YheD family protein [Paenibacillus sp. N1-5-1-14]|uniref:YheC/YheD family endospore coat-associated protein n=1 Tax=Paenibacillus radicibacter TaxID=2972488 RepID=UPI002159AE56|nr:YheC/YheD family protein [Paenibacillus radicibacter]MCR8642064.1 YheC/YheD family protein [Paenibacillus radicibacter]
MSRPVIGILAWRVGLKFKESNYLKQLLKEGQDLGALVYLFSADDVNRDRKSIYGYVQGRSKKLERHLFPWPDVVIDRCRRGDPAYRKVRNSKLFIYANNRYTNKWRATKLFMQTDALQKWMPETMKYNVSNLREMIGKYRILYVKPGNGTGGRSIVKISRTDKGFLIQARSRNLSKKTIEARRVVTLCHWLNTWVDQQRIRKGIFMIQQGLDLQIIPKHVADTRLLIQKDDQGQWTVTGMGIRVGPRNSSTSNLHGGGKAVSFEALITEKFGAEKVQAIRDECFELAFQVVRTIEEHFGNMMEFGLDIGVDVTGRVWLIEVNPKPGRDIFKGLGKMNLYRESCRRPLEYAIFLAKRGNEVITIGEPTPAVLEESSNDLHLNDFRTEEIPVEPEDHGIILTEALEPEQLQSEQLQSELSPSDEQLIDIQPI